MSEDLIVGFNLNQWNKAGLGAIIYLILYPYHYCKSNNYKFGLMKNTNIAKLNGSFKDNIGNDKTWNSYFKSLNIVDNITVEWYYFPYNWSEENQSLPKIEYFSNLLKEIYVLQDNIQKEVDERVMKSGFNPETDIALHIRRTDKIFTCKGSFIEAGELPLDNYVDETLNIINKFYKDKKVRVFLCTDDKLICEKIKKKFKNHEVVWDQNESTETLHVQFMEGKIPRSKAWEDTMNVLTNIQIMSKALYLIGGRMSKMFCIPELLRYPLPSLNIKDSDTEGVVIYSENEPVINPFKKNIISNFVNFDEQERASSLLIKKDFMKNDKILIELNRYNQNWWTHLMGVKDKIICDLPNNSDKLSRYQMYINNKEDSYYFLKTGGNHNKGCTCVVCLLENTFKSFEILDTFSKITGERIRELLNVNVILLKKNNFIKYNYNKGKYTFILAFNKIHLLINEKEICLEIGSLIIFETIQDIKIINCKEEKLLFGSFNGEK